jgi:hypothetical protein
MAPQELEHSAEAQQPTAGPLSRIRSLGFVPRRKASNSGVAWHETVTKHVPEPWPAARLALQARIAALDIEA